MPVYLVHGFRWPRAGFSGIRVHAIVHNLEHTSVEYIQNESSRADILASFRKAHPDLMKELEGPGRKLEFIEQYNPEDVDGPNCVSQPHAYVGDKVVTIAANPAEVGSAMLSPASPTATTQPGGPGNTTVQSPTGTPAKKPARSTVTDMTALSLNLEEVISEGPGLTNRAWEALADLRDKIATGEKIGWWVVYNGDPERAFDDESEEDYDDEDYDMEDFAEEAEDDTAEAGDVDGARQMQYQRRQQQQQQQSPTTQQQQISSQSRTTTTNRPRTAPTSETTRSRYENEPTTPSYIAPRHPQVPTSPTVPHIASQHRQVQEAPDLTALPVRSAGPPSAGAGMSSPLYPPPQPPGLTSPKQRGGGAENGKGKQPSSGEKIASPPKGKDVARSQGLRKKLFGKKL